MLQTRPGILAVWGIVLGSPLVHGQVVSPVDFTQVTRPVVQVTNAELIGYLLFELFIEPLEQPTRMQVIDVTQNGFGPDDVIVVYPSAEAFLIPQFLPDSVQAVMSRWAPEVEYRLDSGNLPSDALAALIGTDPDTTKRAETAIMYDVVQAVERNYRDLPVGILFERDSIGFTFQLWDYNRTAMHYTPRPAFVTDSTVASVLESLQDIGYLPAQGGDGGAVGVGRSAGRRTSVDQALLGIRGLPDEMKRQLATRTVLLGSFDFDRSGSIDTAREIDALPCTVWTVLEGTFPNLLDRFGFSETSTSYLGSMVFSVSERVRGPAARRGATCIQGGVPVPTPVEEVRPAVRDAPLPPPVSEFLATEAAGEIVESTRGEAPGSANWAAAVKRVLLARFDADSSGQLDRRAEVEALPCVVWRVVMPAGADVGTDLGFDGEAGYVGDRIGVAAEQRTVANSRIRACNAGREELTARHVGRSAPAAARPRPRGESDPGAVAAAVSGLASIANMETRQLAARTILRSHFDFDDSGYIDAADELDAIACEVWASLDVAFPGFAHEYGFVESPDRRSYRGNIIFNISDRLDAPAARRIAACLNGQVPPPTPSEGIETSGYVIRLPASVLHFLDTKTAAAIARSTARLEPGSAAWAASVRSVLLAEYDLDRSGWIDSPAEVDEVPCAVWATVQATYGGPLDALGFDGTRRYLGDRIGIDEGQRVYVGERTRACAPPN